MTANKEIIDNLKIICQCNGIKKGTFKKVIADGGDTISKIHHLTRAGSGSCGGKRCGPRLKKMLEQDNLGQTPGFSHHMLRQCGPGPNEDERDDNNQT